MLAYHITNSTIMVVLDNEDITIPRTSPRAPKILDILRAEPVDIPKLRDVLREEYSPETYSDGTVKIMKNGTVTYLGKELPPALARKVTACYEDGVPFQNLLKFFDKLDRNPSQRAVKELYTFLEHTGMPITPDGNFLAYKGISSDGFSCTAGDSSKVIQGVCDDRGRIRNNVGDVIEVKRNYVNDDKGVGCSSGLHAGSLSYATKFGSKTVIVEIDPAYVVSIPTDCSYQKLRCCLYKVVSVYKGKMVDSGVSNASKPYAPPQPEDDGCDDVITVSVTHSVREMADWAEDDGESDARYSCFPDDEEDVRKHVALQFGMNDPDKVPEAVVEAYYRGYRNA